MRRALNVMAAARTGSSFERCEVMVRLLGLEAFSRPPGACRCRFPPARAMRFERNEASRAKHVSRGRAAMIPPHQERHRLRPVEPGTAQQDGARGQDHQHGDREAAVVEEKARRFARSGSRRRFMRSAARRAAATPRGGGREKHRHERENRRVAMRPVGGRCPRPKPEQAEGGDHHTDRET